ncbi:hypothetical protein AMK21_30230 [Streptomyces sp. CB00316]|uniref:hypothetical protein n=1 Tax=Streptomyces sp. CB00316 TaxID=1703932 RepID=UPI00093F17F1|nr:hypothetical protein [Streptomyces sp. CB00316]OKJ10564.1 hypothetical protein AMK21_30230 [Streptomyces sp. CB00316]
MVSEIQILVNRLRVSYLHTHIHEEVPPDIQLPGAFVSRLCDLQPIRSLDVTLPFEIPVDRNKVEWQFWSKVSERRDLRPLSPHSASDRDEAERLRKAMVPLRHRAGLKVSSFERPLLEAFLHPFGWVLLATADLTWQQGIPLDDAVEALDELQRTPASVLLGNAEYPATLDTAAKVAAQEVSRELAGDPAWTGGSHRLATVIDGSVDSTPATMPSAGGAVHRALHHLSSGQSVLTNPEVAFVARWNEDTSAFSWIPTDLVYMLGRGTSIVLPQAIEERPRVPGIDTAGRHRRMALLVSYLAAALGLIQSRPQPSQGGYRDVWAEKAGDRLARLFGPTPAGLDYWGLEARSFLQKTDAVHYVEEIRREAKKRGEGKLFPRCPPPDKYL